MFDSLSLASFHGQLVVGMLMLIRVSALMATAPFFSMSAIPSKVKIILSIIIALSMTAMFGNKQPDIEFQFWTIVVLGLKEFAVGAIIGYTANLMFDGIRFAGGMIDLDIGFQTALVFDPNAMVSPTLIGELKAMTALVIFVMLNGHHFLIEAVYASVQAVPLTTFSLTQSTITMIAKLVTNVCIIAVKIASPVLASLFLTNLAMAMLGKVAPQINVFALNMQAKIAVGLVVLFVSMPLFIMLVKQALQVFQGDVLNVIISLNPHIAQ